MLSAEVDVGSRNCREVPGSGTVSIRSPRRRDCFEKVKTPVSFLFNVLAFPSISSKSLKFQSELLSIPLPAVCHINALAEDPYSN